MEILIADTAMQIKSRYILTFVDVASPYYHDYIEKHTTFCDGLCYTGYLWDCFRNKVPMSEDECIRFIKRQKTIYCFWDIHSKDRILIPNYWKYPKESVLKMTSQEFMRNRDSLPDDIYVMDDTFEWSIAFTHEEDAQQKRFCLFTEGVCRIG